MPSLFNADTKELDKFITTLSEMHRSALPNVVRNTLNDLAFNAKKTELTRVTNDKFTVRSKNFFKANSRFTKATGYNVNTMHSDMGMVAKDVATRNLKQQEEGGQIGKRAFIPNKRARIGSSQSKKISSRNKLSKVNFIDSGKIRRGAKNQRLNRAAAIAKRTGKDVLHKDTVYRVKSMIRKKGDTIFKLVPLYDYKKGRAVKVDKTNFMQATGEASQTKYAIAAFKSNTEKQIAKLKSKGRL